MKYVDFITSGLENPLLVMELVKGCDLQQTLREQSRLDLADTQRLSKQLLSSLRYLHENHITHRDLKPANIIMAKRSPLSIKLTDFGLAATRTSSLVTYCGSKLYMAPEVREKRYSDKIDVWSVGIIILEVQVGLPSPSKKTWGDQLLVQARALWPAPILQLVQSLLQHNPTQCPSAADALHHEFHTISPDSYLGPPTQPNQNVGTSIQSLDASTQIFSPLPQDINDMQEVDNAIWEPAFWDWNQDIYGLPETSKPSKNAGEN